MNKVRNLFKSTLRKSGPFVFLFVVLVLSLLEVFAYKKTGRFSYTASRLWLAIGAWYTINCLVFILKAFLSDIREFNIVSLLAIIVIFYIVCGGVGRVNDNADIDFEATQQIAIGLNNYLKPDFHYTGVSLLGHPAREILITSLPALLMGRSILALHLGFAIPFLLGIFICYAGLRDLVVKKFKLNPALASLAVLSFLTFPYLIEFLRYYNTAFSPMGHTIHALGWFFLVLNRPTLNRFCCLMWIGSLLGTSYMPALASWSLLLVMLMLVLIQFAFSKKDNLLINTENISDKAAGLTAIGGTIIFIFVIGLCSFLTRSNISDGIGRVFVADVLNSLKAGYEGFVLGTPYSFLGVLGTPVLLYLIVGITGRLGIVHFILAGWVLSVVAVSVVLHGYSSPPPSLALCRALTIIPPAIAAISYVLFRWLSKNDIRVKSSLLYAVLAVFTVICFSNLYKKKNIYPSMILMKPAQYVITDMVEQANANHINQLGKCSIVLITDDLWKTNLGDYTKYFFPNCCLHVVYQNQNIPQSLEYKQGALIYIDQGKDLPSAIKIPPDSITGSFSYKESGKSCQVKRIIVRPDVR